MSKIFYWYSMEKVQNSILSNFCIVYIVEISIFQAIAKEKHWLLGTLITILIQGIAHDEASLYPYLQKYLKMLRPLKLTLYYIRFLTNATVARSPNLQLNIPFWASLWGDCPFCCLFICLFIPPLP